MSLRRTVLLESCFGLYTPPDLLEAHAAWKANCGPGALAAALAMPVMKLHPLFRVRFPAKPWTTPTMMQAALAIIGERVRVGRAMPQGNGKGLLLLQLRGAWDSAPMKVQYRHTHWVAWARHPAAGLWVYDVNGLESGAWMPSETWKQQVLSAIIAQKPGASGRWAVRTALELLPEVQASTAHAPHAPPGRP